MHKNVLSSLRLLLPVLILALAAPALAGFEEQRSFRSDSLTVNNLIGEVRVTGHDGPSFEVRVQVRGTDASREVIEILTDEGAEPRLTVAFPIEDERNYVYPALGSDSRTSFTLDKKNDSWLGALLGSLNRRKITVRGSGSGLEVWADVEIRVPAGGSLAVNHGVGTIVAKKVEGHLSLDNQSGAIEATDVTGDVVADTGSGHVTVREIRGHLHADTGSGHVEVESCRGESIKIDTGSGHVTVRDAETPTLYVDTGSGAVRATAIRSDSVWIDTGSGSVNLELRRMGDGDYHIDTGSGGVTLALPANASAEVRAETGSGSIELDLDDGVTVHHKERDEIRFRVGGGAADVQIDTGSGGIRIRRAE